MLHIRSKTTGNEDRKLGEFEHKSNHQIMCSERGSFSVEVSLSVSTMLSL